MNFKETLMYNNTITQDKTISSDKVVYGPETTKAMEYLHLCDMTIERYPQMLVALGKVKKACAMTNKQIQALDKYKADAIISACDELIAGQLTQQFPLSAIGGFGPVLNMVANEVLARRANYLLEKSSIKGDICPNTHVNMGQSSNDVIKTAQILAVYDEINYLLDATTYLEEPLLQKSIEFNDVVKMGRISYQDAVPITMGQEFSGYHSQIKRNRLRLAEERNHWQHVPLGATILGTGLGCKPGYFNAVCDNLSLVCGRTIKQSDNLFDAMQTADAYVMLHAHIQSLAICAAKIALDIRVMASGPRAGLREITLKALQPGSSIMPGKVNPVIPHMVTQISQKISANHAGIATAVCAGELELSSTSSVIIKSIFDSVELLGKGIKILGEKVVIDIKANKDHCREMAEKSLGLSTVINTLFGYETSLQVTKLATENNLTCKQAAIQAGLLSNDEADEIFNLDMLTNIELSEKVFSKFISSQR